VSVPDGGGNDGARMTSGARLQFAGLAVCGVVIGVSVAWVATFDPTREVTRFLWLTGVAVAAYAAGMALVARGIPDSRGLLAGALLLAAVWRVPLVLAPPLLSTDIYRYIWDGRIQRLRHNPYGSAPADPALQHLHSPLTRLTEHADLPTIYPPAAEIFFRAVASVDESVLAFKVAITLCDVVIALLLLGWLGVIDRSRWWVLAYAWHPLVALEGAGSGHIDFLGVALLVGGAVALARRRGLLAATALALAVAVKFIPLVLAPMVLGRLTWRHAAAGAGVLLALYAWFGVFLDGPVMGSLGEYARRWRFNGPAFGFFEGQFGMDAALALPIVVGWLVAAWVRGGPSESSGGWAWPLAATLLLMPAIYPWYLVWLVPFLAVGATLPVGVWTLSVLLTYAVWAVDRAGGGWVLPPWVVPVEYGAVLAASLYAISRPWCITTAAAITAATNPPAD